MRPWLVMTHAGANFDTDTVSLPHMLDSAKTTTKEKRRELGSIHGLFPILRVKDDDGDDTVTGIHESLAICEYIAEVYPDAKLWPSNALDRARARAVSCEMASGFPHLRNELSCVLFGRVPSSSFTPAPKTLVDIERVFEIWTECLERSGGPYLFGANFGIADAMYYPVLTRFRTYGVEIEGELLQNYAAAVEALPAVRQLVEKAKSEEPTIPTYDAYIKKLGGDPEGGLADTS